MTRIYITAAQLEKAGACSDQLELFRKTFGERTIVTVRKAVKVAHLFNWDWAACLLDAEGLAEYKRVTAQAWAECQRVRAQAWAEYERVTAQAWAESQRVRAQAWAEYQRITAQAWASAYIATMGRVAA